MTPPIPLIAWEWRKTVNSFEVFFVRFFPLWRGLIISPCHLVSIQVESWDISFLYSDQTVLRSDISFSQSTNSVSCLHICQKTIFLWEKNKYNLTNAAFIGFIGQWCLWLRGKLSQSSSRADGDRYLTVRYWGEGIVARLPALFPPLEGMERMITIENSKWNTWMFSGA